MTGQDPHGLCRFLRAQGCVYDPAVERLRRGTCHAEWTHAIFPPLAGLSRDETTERFALRSIDEAAAYLEHAVLGARYRRCVGELAPHLAKPPYCLFGPCDTMRLWSSLTLFEAVEPAPAFTAVLDAWFAGRREERTLERLGRTAPHGGPGNRSDPGRHR